MWYDIFSSFYDKSLERLYLQSRKEAIAVLNPAPGSLVLDIACGTGQNFPHLKESINDGVIVGVDRSRGMLKRAQNRCEKEGWENVILVCSDILDFDNRALEKHSGKKEVDVVICTLGFSVIDDWVTAFQRSFNLLKSGGRFAIFDVYAEKRIFQTWATEVVSGADLSRKVWEVLENEVELFDKRVLPGSPSTFGGELYVAVGEKQ